MEQKKNIPVHVSIIMDGNGRWAKSRGLERTAGHVEGVERVRDVVEACGDAGVRYLSLYAFSEENWGRPAEEVKMLMKLLMKSIVGEERRFMENRIRLLVLGNRKRLDREFDAAITELERKTSVNDRFTLIVFISYSGKWDLLQAAKRLALDFGGDPERIAAADFSDIDDRLVTAGIPDPDLLIRTSGEQRLSNYLLWQSAYTEFYFTPVLWPDFGKEQLLEALAAYSDRDRRYGKVK